MASFEAAPRLWTLSRVIAILGVLAIVTSGSSSSQSLPVSVNRSKSGPLLARSRNGLSVVSVSVAKSVDVLGTRGFDVLSTSPAGKKSLFVPSIIEQPSALSVVSTSRAVLFGDVTWSVQAFTIFNTKEGTVEMQVPCRSPALSPDGTKVAFVRFFPEHFVPVAATSAVYMVFDLSAAIRETNASLRSFVGTRVYPESDSRGSSSDESDVHRLSGNIRWISNSGFSFTDRYRGLKSAVIVQLSGSRWISSMRSIRRPERRR